MMTTNDSAIRMGSPICDKLTGVSDQEAVVNVNHPQLPSMISLAKLRLSFLMKCRPLKRPPVTLRVKSNKTQMVNELNNYTKVCSKAESELLETEISVKKKNIKNLIKLRKLSDPKQLEPLDLSKIQSTQSNLAKRLNTLKSESLSKWSEWPDKLVNNFVKPVQKSVPKSDPNHLSQKRLRNRKKRHRKSLKKFQQIVENAKNSGVVRNLSDNDIPDEVFALLSRRKGFVPTPKCDFGTIRRDASEAIGKLCSKTLSKLKVDDEEQDQTDEGSNADESVEGIEILSPETPFPNDLKRKRVKSAESTGDPVVDQLATDVKTKIDSVDIVYEMNNLSKSELKALKWLTEKIDIGELVLVEADKGGALIIAKPDYIRGLTEDKLHNVEYYQNMGAEYPYLSVHKSMLEIWRKGERDGVVDRDTVHDVVGITEKGNQSTSPVYKPGEPYFYALLKIHKLEPSQIVPNAKIPVRLVANLANSATARSDKYINWRFLKPLQDKFCPNLVQDSTQWLLWLEERDNLIERGVGTKGFSWDFVALYDNLHPDLVITALKHAIEQTDCNWTQGEIDWLIDLVEISIRNAYARYGKNWFKILKGIATGGNISVTLANITVAYCLDLVFKQLGGPPSDLIGYRTFVDDIGGLWKGTADDFVVFSERVNQLLFELSGLSIKDPSQKKWDINDGDTFTVFLDVKFRFDPVNGLVTDVNIKKTDARAYLNFDSYHPQHMFPSIVYSQMLRYRRIINSESVLKLRLEELSKYFLMSGYPKKMVHSVMTDVLGRKRSLQYKKKNNLPPFQVTWVTTYTPASKVIQDIVNSTNDALKLSKTWENDRKPVGIVHRRAPNLGSKLFKRRVLSLNGHESTSSTGSVRCTTAEVASKKRGPKCKTCGMMSNKSVIKSTANGKTFKTPPADCNSNNVIYLAECRLCGMQYTGRTVQLLRNRISGHRLWMNKAKSPKVEGKNDFINEDEAALSDHLKSVHNLSTSDDFDKNLEFTVIKFCDPRDLENSEFKSICDMKTSSPFGLNIAKPFGLGEKFL